MVEPKATVKDEVWRLHQVGVPKTVIAKNMGVGRNTVARWVKAMAKTVNADNQKEMAGGADTPAPATTDTTEDASAVA